MFSQERKRNVSEVDEEARTVLILRVSCTVNSFYGSSIAFLEYLKVVDRFLLTSLVTLASIIGKQREDVQEEAILGTN
ncbi:hypothetical protein GEV33_006964 [Tenebrio molitor]|uniref:Uncharacterized protein n=1 Tax=Tenebrio molitor TaxID=7067 RepID=A0A8J6LCR2_TENMO|nr:hypothetical protein GEV33_006964 [Tenebrio molitor]